MSLHTILSKIALLLPLLLSLSTANSSEVKSPPHDPTVWIPFAANPDGSIRWLVRNFKTITPADKFTFEGRIEFSAASGVQVGEKMVRSIEFKSSASCEDFTTHVTSDKAFSKSGVIVVENSLVEPAPSVPKPNTTDAALLKFICSANEPANTRTVPLPHTIKT